MATKAQLEIAVKEIRRHVARAEKIIAESSSARTGDYAFNFGRLESSVGFMREALAALDGLIPARPVSQADDQ